MLRRMTASTLFTRDLAGECRAARQAWKLKEHEAVDWTAGIVPLPAEQVRQAMSGRQRVHLLIVNTPRECVLGGTRPALQELVRDLGTSFVPLAGVSTVHCPIAAQVEQAYRDLHLLRTDAAWPVFDSTAVPGAEVTTCRGKVRPTRSWPRLWAPSIFQP